MDETTARPKPEETPLPASRREIERLEARVADLERWRESRLTWEEKLLARVDALKPAPAPAPAPKKRSVWDE